MEKAFVYGMSVAGNNFTDRIEESPHRQGIDYRGEGRHLHCRLCVRALV